MLCVDENSQIQVLDRTQPVLPMQPHLIERRSYDYIRHGASTLFAALDIATGLVTAALKLATAVKSSSRSCARSLALTRRASCTW